MTGQDERELAERLRHHGAVLRSDMDDPWMARDVEKAADLIEGFHLTPTAEVKAEEVVHDELREAYITAVDELHSFTFGAPVSDPRWLLERITDYTTHLERYLRETGGAS